MIQVTEGFNVRSNTPVDSRLTLTKSEMKEMKDVKMPEVYLATCKDDGLIYVYNKDNIIDENYGKFRPYKTGNADAEVVDETLILKF